MNYRTILVAFFLINSILISCKSQKHFAGEITFDKKNLYPSETIVFEKHTDWTRNHYPERIEYFRNNPLEQGDIVFIGNSLTEQGKDWGRWFSEVSVKNRGISGDITEGVLYRLNEVCYYKPEALFILIGINDLFNGTIPNDKVLSNIFQIVKFVNKSSTKTKVYVQSLLPTSNENLIGRISQINKKLERNEGSAKYEFIDIHHLFANEKDLMAKKYTTDGTHLNDAGYQVWAEHLKKYIEK